MIIYSKTSIGNQHVAINKECQDYSSHIILNDKYIVTSCDGHGGEIYIRSAKGSKFASDSIVKVLSTLTYDELYADEKLYSQIKIKILCEWNKLISDDLNLNPIKEEEMRKLNERQKKSLLNNQIQAYGTTLIGALVIKDKCLVIHLGDGESFLIKDSDFIPCFEEKEDDPVGNLTYSMCGDDAFDHMNVRCIDFNDINGIFICSDGLVNPYLSYDNFYNLFFKEYLYSIQDGSDIKRIEEEIIRISKESCIGDDVSMGIIFNNNKRK